MARPDALYVGLRCSSAAPHGGPTLVGVREREGDRRLERHPKALTLPCAFEWGYEGTGPKVLAEAILADRLGHNPNLAMTAAFAREVVAHLEREFELHATHIDEWVAHRVLQATRP